MDGRMRQRDIGGYSFLMVLLFRSNDTWWRGLGGCEGKVGFSIYHIAIYLLI
jgi:hypothetical protein